MGGICSYLTGDEVLLCREVIRANTSRAVS